MNSKLKYQQVYDELLSQIKNDWFLPGQKIPSENELAIRHNVSRVTIRKALKQLESEGLLDREKGKGTFVKRKLIEKKMGRVVSFTESTIMLGNTPSSKCIFFEKQKSPLIAQNYLNLDEKEETWVIKRIRYANGLTVLYEESYWVASVCGVLTKDIAESSIISHLRSIGVRLGYGKQEFIALSADEELSSVLGVNVGFPILRSTMSFFTKLDEPIFIAVNYYRTDRVTITSTRFIDD